MYTLVSKADYSVVIKYNGEEMVISPKQIIKRINPKLLDQKLPDVVKLIKEG